MLQGRAAAAGLSVDAQPRGSPHRVGQRDVEHLHVHRAHVASDPLLEDVHQEAAVLLTADGAAGDQVALLLVERAGLVAVTPAGLGDLEQLRRGPLDDGDELDEVGLDLVAEEAVDLLAAVTIDGVDRAQDVELGPGLLQQASRSHDLGVRALAALVHALGVVDVLGPVHGEPEQEVVLGEEGRPLLVELGAVGLQRVLDDLAGLAVLLHQPHRLAVEVEAHERGLTALPGDGHALGAVALDELADVLLLRLIGHAELAARVERFLGEEEAVGAVEVADRAGRLGQHVERRRRAGRQVRQHWQHAGGRTGGRLWCACHDVPPREGSVRVHVGEPTGHVR